MACRVAGPGYRGYHGDTICNGALKTLVKLNKIYTKTGDDGTTGLGTGERCPKDAIRVEAFGTVDELNAALGVARLYSGPTDLDSILNRIQNDLFDLGADLCIPETENPLAYEPLRIVITQVEQLERDIDKLNESLAPLTSFILPAGSPLATHLHLARTIARRAERHMVTLARQATINKQAMLYINRLSDLLFVMARIANHDEGGDVLWVPGKNR
jgi:cob(I)alamin adenosyltransferase